MRLDQNGQRRGIERYPSDVSDTDFVMSSTESPQLRPQGMGELSPKKLKRRIGQLDEVVKLCEVSLEAKSSVIESYHLRHIWACLPAKVRHHNWRLLYSLAEHGASLETLYRRCSVTNEPCVTVIADMEHRRFGCFTSNPWRIDKDAYGSGEGFVFTFLTSAGEVRDLSEKTKENFVVQPTELQQMKLFPWVKSNRLFQRSTPSTGIQVGGGDEGSAIAIHPDMLNGASRHSETYENDILCKSTTGEFKVLHFEVWGLGWRNLKLPDADLPKGSFFTDRQGLAP